MHILLVAATSFEIQPSIDAGASPHNLITGIGSTPATWSLMRQIDTRRPDLIIQAGIAGCLTGEKPGTVFAIGEDEFADLGVWENENFQSPFDLGLAEADLAPFSNGKLPNPYPDLLALTDLPIANALTVNEITTSAARIAWYRNNTGAAVESMEGAALHYVCRRENIPFLQLRSVSNDIGVRDKSKWDIRLAIACLNDQLIRIVKMLSLADPSILTPLKR